MLRVRAYAKINLALAVLGKRADGFHDIRTIFHTISIADDLTIRFNRSRTTAVSVTSSVEIPGENIAAKAAHLVLEAAKVSGKVDIHIHKRIPMGGGLGGGSTDAAAVLRALPALIGRKVAFAPLAVQLGSDVPFFLHGGCALGMGRGEELYPLPDARLRHGVLLTPQVHVSTKDAYSALNRQLTQNQQFPILERLQSLAWGLEVRAPKDLWAADCINDFEEVVFRQYPVLSKLQRKLSRMGAAPARMTGSGAALFGFYSDQAAVQAAVEQFGQVNGTPLALPFSLLSRSAYQSRWSRWISGIPGQ